MPRNALWGQDWLTKVSTAKRRNWIDSCQYQHFESSFDWFCKYGNSRGRQNLLIVMTMYKGNRSDQISGTRNPNPKKRVATRSQDRVAESPADVELALLVASPRPPYFSCPQSRRRKSEVNSCSLRFTGSPSNPQDAPTLRSPTTASEMCECEEISFWRLSQKIRDSLRVIFVLWSWPWNDNVHRWQHTAMYL